jgi:cell division initiation protein
MKITPLEIRQKSFEKIFRGYDKEEVNAFLLSLSHEWERMLDEQKEFRYKLEASEREIEKLREVENSLFKTLKTAEDTGTNLIEQANKTAELHLKEAQMKADALLFEAKTKAKSIIDDAEVKARQILDEMEEDVKHLEDSFKYLDNHRDNLITDLRNLANDTLEKVERATAKKKVNIHQHREKARDVSVDHNSGQMSGAPTEKDEPREGISYEQPQEVTHEKKSGSFFDDLQ